mmetsp:Transcript_3347/g.9845  ORF Transcript_3347/g.9845 Transcript_3347/m.9845 type:complete len:203 (-) Transcript_3347:211-819(-)
MAAVLRPLFPMGQINPVRPRVRRLRCRRPVPRLALPVRQCAPALRAGLANRSSRHGVHPNISAFGVAAAAAVRRRLEEVGVAILALLRDHLEVLVELGQRLFRREAAPRRAGEDRDGLREVAARHAVRRDGFRRLGQVQRALGDVGEPLVRRVDLVDLGQRPVQLFKGAEQSLDEQPRLLVQGEVALDDLDVQPIHALELVV